MNAADNKKDNHLAGFVYDLYAAPKEAVRPANQWNQTRIVASGSHVEHWLNGKKVASYDVGSADWNAAIKASKFNPEKFPSFGKAPKGYLGIQGDHPGRWHCATSESASCSENGALDDLKVERLPQRLDFKSLA